MAQAAKEAAMNEPAEEPQVQSDSDEDADIPGENEQIRALKARRRELKALLSAQRPEARTVLTGKKTKKEKTMHHKALKAGYTVTPKQYRLIIDPCVRY